MLSDTVLHKVPLSSGKAPYRLVHTGPVADRYADRPLPGSTAKIGRRRSIEEEKGKRRRGKERRRSTSTPSSPARCPHALATREPSPPARPRRPRDVAVPGSPTGDYCPRAARGSPPPGDYCPLRWERDQGDLLF
ncbi:hypothetical protein GW17_00002688 [Ensete ventricosum]|nr:hypothetical protein GW17_00002688 [Ensete ventricosum]